MVNRGFVPTELRDPASRPGASRHGEATVTGLVRAPEARDWFTPDDDRPQDKLVLPAIPAPSPRATGLAASRPSTSRRMRRPNPGRLAEGRPDAG